MAEVTNITQEWSAGVAASGDQLVQNIGTSPVVVGTGASAPTTPNGGTILQPGESRSVADTVTYYLRAASALPAKVDVSPL